MNLESPGGAGKAVTGRPSAVTKRRKPPRSENEFATEGLSLLTNFFDVVGGSQPSGGWNNKPEEADGGIISRMDHFF